ncbi:MAG: hypothetical protein C5B52_00645 [Bacteroidetes bacterium]|nr:MAG: hypothetical protein C5B52_00645 [Bacteroidota bacterium]
MLKIIRKNPFYYLLYALIFLIGLVLLASFPKTESVQWINNHWTPARDIFFRFYTYLGEGWVLVALCLILFFRNKWWGWMALLSFALTTIISQLMKQVIYPNEARPFAVLKEVGLLHVVNGVEIHLTNSFPSGHTITAFSIATLLAYHTKNKLISALLLVYAVGVAYSRMYLGQHFLVDTTFGSLIGVLTTMVSIYIVERVRDKKNKGKILQAKS